MPIGTANVHAQPKIGSCPHGMPLGACPICNGAAGGNSTTKRDIPRNVGEMTYNQCAAIGAILKSQRHAKQQAEVAEQFRMKSLAEFQKNISKIYQRLLQLTTQVSKSFPPVIAKPINFVLNKLVGNILSIIQNIPIFITNIAKTISQKIFDISDKLAAIYGEFKVAVGEKISKFLSSIKKKIKSLFFVSETLETDEEENKIEEDKRQFEIKTFIHSLYKKLKDQDKKEVEKNAHKSVE